MERWQLSELALKGSDYEIGRMHAEACGPAIDDGLLGLYLKLWERGFAGGPGKADRRWLQWTVEKTLVATLARRFPPSLRDRIRGFCEVSGRSPGAMAVATVLPDLMPILQGQLARLGLVRVMPPRPPVFGCSSFIANGDKFLFGRNLDFPGVGYWERYPILQSFAVPGRLRYVGVATAGVPVGGITGVNEARVALALHQHYFLGGNFSAPPPFAIAEEILQTARSFDEAKEMAECAPIGSAWAFVIACGNTRRSAVIERTASYCGVVEPNAAGVVAHSNYFQSRSQNSREYSVSERMNWDNWCRRNRLYEQVSSYGPSMTIAQAAQALSEHYDPYWGEEKHTNRVVSQLYNLQSVIFDLEAMEAWTAEGEAPVHLRRYRRYRLGEALEGRKAATEETVPAYTFRSPEVAQAKQKYVDAFVDGFDAKWDSSLQHLRQAQERHFIAEGCYAEALLHWKLKDAAKGLEATRVGRAHIEKQRGGRSLPPEYFELRLAEARSLDLAGRRDEALVAYAALAKVPDLKDSTIRRAAEKARPYRWSDVAAIFTPFSAYVPSR